MSTRRQDYNIKLNPTLTTRTTSNGTSGKATGFNAAYRCSETTTGVTRHKPQGWMPPTAYTYKRVKISAPFGTCLHQVGPVPSSTTGQMFTGVVGTLGGDSGVYRFIAGDHFNACLTEGTAQSDIGLRNQALIKARGKLKQQSVNLGVAYGERNATARMLGDTTTRMANSFRHLRRGQVRKAMDELGISSKKREPRGSNVPNKWLELQYGWKPMCSDVFGAVNALSKRTPDDWLVTARATATDQTNYTYSVIGVPGYSGSDACVVTAWCSRSVYTRIDVIPQNEAIISLASLGILNPLEVAWELVPYSFVVDWAWPIGNYLSSLDAMFGYEAKAYTSSLLVRANWRDEGSSAYASNGAKIENRYTGTKELVYLDRQVSTSVEVPSLPRFKDPRSLGHMANGLALLATAFGRR